MTPSPAVLRALHAYQESVRGWAARRPHLVEKARQKAREKAAVGNTLAALELAVLDELTEAHNGQA